MKQVTLTRDMRPWQAGAVPVLPDAVADKLITAGDATAYEPKPGDIVFAPDAPRPVTRFLTRRKG